MEAVARCEVPASFPGADASPAELLDLAQRFRAAAEHLLSLTIKGRPESLAPFRLAAIHAIELYFNALLVKEGIPPGDVRGMQHDLAKRLNTEQVQKLNLRGRTALHLVKLTEGREYLVARYDPKGIREASEINRVTATLNEVDNKVSKALASKPTPASVLPSGRTAVR